jgi:hypothetical protein
MDISCVFMPLLTELGDSKMGFCCKQVAPNGAAANSAHAVPIYEMAWLLPS